MMRSKGSCNLLKISTGEIYYVVGGGKPTQHFNNYEDATEAFNLRWMQEEYGENNQL
ncbi:MAG: hypothetical protein WBJ17_00635 [Natronincolaceae bacterium]